MSVKDFLERARHLDDAINSQVAELAHLRELSMKISSSRLEEHIDRSSPQEAPFTKWVERIVDKEKEINAAIDKLVAVKLEISDLSLRAVEELMSLKPFGEGFKLPLFYIPVIHQNYVSLIKGMYKKGSTFQNGEAIESICFQTSVVKKLESNDWNELIFTLGINEFKGKKTVSLNIKDVVEMD